MNNQQIFRDGIFLNNDAAISRFVARNPPNPVKLRKFDEQNAIETFISLMELIFEGSNANNDKQEWAEKELLTLAKKKLSAKNAKFLVGNDLSLADLLFFAFLVDRQNVNFF
jgi:glutathione S-transferase